MSRRLISPYPVPRPPVMIFDEPTNARPHDRYAPSPALIRECRDNGKRPFSTPYERQRKAFGPMLSSLEILWTAPLAAPCTKAPSHELKKSSSQVVTPTTSRGGPLDMSSQIGIVLRGARSLRAANGISTSTRCAIALPRGSVGFGAPRLFALSAKPGRGSQVMLADGEDSPVVSKGLKKLPPPNRMFPIVGWTAPKDHQRKSRASRVIHGFPSDVARETSSTVKIS